MNPVEQDIEAMLRQSTFLSNLAPDQLHWLIQNGDLLDIQEGEKLITENVMQSGFFIVLSGAFEIIREVGDEEIVIAVHQRGQILGEISVIANLPPVATVRADCPSKVFKIDREIFYRLLIENPDIGLEIVRTAVRRLRTFEAMVNQNEKLAALGTLAAGLAHELNNPAAAARRSTAQLRQAINSWTQSRDDLDSLSLEPHHSRAVSSRLHTDIAAPKTPGWTVDPLARSEQEQEIEDWLDSKGVVETWEYAPTLVDFGWTPDSLASWSAQFPPTHLPAILCWLVNGYIVHTLLDEIDRSTERISDIVKTVKSYTYLDQAPKQAVDIHEGLESTLTILKHKLPPTITIQREFDVTMPHLEAYASELNQVWTNLIDNAIDAMHGSGTLRLRTSQKSGQAVVEVGDTGPGIPEKVLPNLFEPFYTTKGPGKGTGLGLYVSYSIIEKHGGKITVESKPGNTRFVVTIPFKLE